MCDMKARLRNPKLTPEALRTWRTSLGWTQVQLAAQLGCTQVTIAQWETGVRQPPFYLGLALNWLRHVFQRGTSF